MTIDDFYKFYKTQLFGKVYCCYKEVEDNYHYERISRGYDHLGSLGYDEMKIVDTYKTIIKKEKINRRNVIKVVDKLVKKEGWLEDY